MHPQLDIHLLLQPCIHRTHFISKACRCLHNSGRPIKLLRHSLPILQQTVTPHQIQLRHPKTFFHSRQEACPTRAYFQKRRLLPCALLFYLLQEPISLPVCPCTVFFPTVIPSRTETAHFPLYLSENFFDILFRKLFLPAGHVTKRPCKLPERLCIPLHLFTSRLTRL